MSEGVPAPRKRTQPAKPRVSAKKIKAPFPPPTTVKEEEAPVVVPPVPMQDTVVWEKELDDLFRSLRRPSKDKIHSDPTCPLHAHLLRKKVSKKGWEYVRCSEKNCPIWLPCDHHLGYVLAGVQNKMRPSLRQGFFFFFVSVVNRVKSV